MATNNDLRFSNISMLPVFNTENWTLENASINTETGVLTISPGGSAYVLPSQTIVNLCFQHCKIYIKFKNDAMLPSNNFKSGPKIEIRETYKNTDNAINKNVSRCLGLNVFTEVDADNHIYSDTTIFKTLNKPLAAYLFKIINTSNSDLVIYDLGAYTSIDISEDQVSNVVSNVNTSTKPGSFKVYFTDETYGMLSGLGAVLANQSNELKYKPIYANGLLGNIETNFGVTFGVVNIPEPIDLST